MARLKNGWKPISLGTLFLACSSSSLVNMQVTKPAEIHLPGVRKLAVVDFQGPKQSGRQFATLLQANLIQGGQYDLLERDQLKSIIDEQQLSMSGVVDETTAVQLGRVLGVDAMIFGEVTTYQVEPDERGSEKVSKKVGTGKYETVERKNLFTGKKYQAKEEIMKTVLVDQAYRIRRGAVSVNFRVVDVETAQLLAVHSESKSYDSGKVVEGSHQSLKPQGAILSELAAVICKKFANMISIHEVTARLFLESGKGNIDLGRKYAETGLWPEAYGAWTLAVKEMPNEPASYYNLGVYHEVEGDFDKAEAFFKKALGLKQKKRYMESIARLRKTREDQARLEAQMQDMEGPGGAETD